MELGIRILKSYFSKILGPRGYGRVPALQLYGSSMSAMWHRALQAPFNWRHHGGTYLVFIFRLYLVSVRKPSKVPCHWTSICSPYFPKTYEWTQKNINNLVLKNISVRSTVIFFIEIFLSWKQSFPDYTFWITLNILFLTPYIMKSVGFLKKL